jgi:hypothetical protein
MAIDVGVVTAVVSTPMVVVDVVVVVVVVVVVGRGDTVLFEMGTETELSTSMATTSAGEEPHDTHINKENATAGPNMCLSRVVITRD